MEQNYDFRARHWQVHKPHRRDADRLPKDTELCIENGWCIGCGDGLVTQTAVSDLIEYFWVSMGISVARTGQPQPHSVWFTVDETVDKGFVLDITENSVLVRLSSDSEAFRAAVHLEDLMNLERAPVLPLGTLVRKPLYQWRTVHSGTGMDEFPDAELRAMVHAGYDAVVVFIDGIDHNRTGHCNISDIIHRCKRFGVQVVLYNYIRSYVHPDDPGAAQVFDAAYGELFRRYPDAVGIMLCGESLEFPSRDPHTTGKRFNESVVDGIPDTRPSPGWYPCSDYPDYLRGIAQAVHAVKPDAAVIFSTYNWGYEKDDVRANFIRRLPEGIRISVPYENFDSRTLEGLRTPILDYTISQAEPGHFFRTEIASCKARGVEVQGNVNTTGIAWDFGCVPVVPAPYKILARMRNLRWACTEYGVTSHYAGHHYGWWDSVAADLGKWTAWAEFEPDYDILLEKIAVRDYGTAAAPHVLAAWKAFDEAMNHYLATNEDQYGPWRVGAAYPFIFQPNITRTMLGKEIQFPTAPHAHFGYRIIKTLYQPYENIDQAPAFLRYPAELRSLDKMEALWVQGLAEAQKADDTDEGKRLAALGQFILCSIRTVRHIKKWWLANMELQLSKTQAEALEKLDEIEAIAHAESENARNCVPAAEFDSRLGWEPSMEYVCDPWHLDWKQRQLESALREVAIYRSIVENAYAK